MRRPPQSNVAVVVAVKMKVWEEACCPASMERCYATAEDCYTAGAAAVVQVDVAGAAESGAGYAASTRTRAAIVGAAVDMEKRKSGSDPSQPCAPTTGFLCLFSPRSITRILQGMTCVRSGDHRAYVDMQMFWLLELEGGKRQESGRDWALLVLYPTDHYCPDLLQTLKIPFFG